MSLITTRSLLLYEIADFDACDTYGFLIQNVEEGLTFGSGFVSERRPVSEYSPTITVTCTEEALEAGTSPLLLSQGAVLAGAEELSGESVSSDTHTPPFMLSRALYARLVSGERVTLTLADSEHEFTLVEDVEVAIDEEEGRELNVREAVEVYEDEVIVAASDEGDFLVVARDPVRPVIVYMRWDGECYLALSAYHEV